MEQDMKETNLLEEQTKVEEWLTEKNIDEQQEIQHSIIFYKHGANNMAEMSVENSNKLQMNAAWLKGIATGDTNLTSRFILHSEAGLVETYLLIRDTLNLQTIDESQEPLSVSNKNFAESSVKFKQRKNTKPLKEHKESMKRIKQPENWKVNLKKNARLKGEEYIGVGGKIVPAKKMGHPCVCRMHCAEKIDEKEREELHKSFWRIYTWQQRKQYIAKSVKESPKQRTRLRNNVQPERSSRCRQVTFTYSLLLKGEFITVCKSMFLSTFAISEKFVRHVMEKKRMSPSGIIEPDQRVTSSLSCPGWRFVSRTIVPAPKTVCAANLYAKGLAGPEEAKAVIGSMKFSETSSQMPTAENSFSAISASLSLAYFPRANTVAPQPTNAVTSERCPWRWKELTSCCHVP